MEILPFENLELIVDNAPKDFIDQFYVNGLKGRLVEVSERFPDILVGEALLLTEIIGYKRELERSGTDANQIFERAGVYNAGTFNLLVSEYVRGYKEISEINSRKGRIRNTLTKMFN